MEICQNMTDFQKGIYNKGNKRCRNQQHQEWVITRHTRTKVKRNNHGLHFYLHHWRCLFHSKHCWSYVCSSSFTLTLPWPCLFQGAEQVTHLCRLLHGHSGKMSNNEVAPPCKPLSDSQRIRKVIRELIETERHYVKVRLQIVVASHSTVSLWYGGRSIARHLLLLK